jgi:aquaporin Z
MTVGTPSTLLGVWREHWPEYVIEGWALGTFMLSASVVVVLLESRQLPIRELIPNPLIRRMLVGTAMGLTAFGLIYSPWGRRSGAHMNPAVTLAFLRLRLVRPIDGLFYMLGQTIGGTLGVFAGFLLTAGMLAAPEARWVVTVPGSCGPFVAFGVEFLMAMLLMLVVLRFSNTPRLRGFTGCAAALLVMTFITVAAPCSGMSINPARTLASAIPSQVWTAFWVFYLLAPPLGMLAAAELHRWQSGGLLRHCAKLCHDNRIRCIHCGYTPSEGAAAVNEPQPESAARRSHV